MVKSPGSLSGCCQSADWTASSLMLAVAAMWMVLFLVSMLASSLMIFLLRSFIASIQYAPLFLIPSCWNSVNVMRCGCGLRVLSMSHLGPFL